MYVLIIDGSIAKFPYSVRQLKQDNAGVFFPSQPSEQLLASYGVFKVTEVTPELSATQVVEYSDTPSLVGDQWQLVHTLRDKTTDELAVEIKAECERRIYAVASDNAQKNMTAAGLVGGLTTEQMGVLRSGVQWIASCQAKAKELIASGTSDYQEDSHWPAPTQAMIDLAKLF